MSLHPFLSQRKKNKWRQQNFPLDSLGNTLMDRSHYPMQALVLTGQAIVLRKCGIWEYWEHWIWWCLLALVVPFPAGFQQSLGQPFLPSYAVTNLQLHRGETCLSWFCFCIPPRCSAMFLTVMHYGPLVSHPSSNKVFIFISVIFSGMKSQPHFLLSLSVIFLVQKPSNTSCKTWRCDFTKSFVFNL